MTASLMAPPRGTSDVTTTHRATRATRTTRAPQTPRPRSAAVQRAYARRAQRTTALHPARRHAAASSRLPFVVLVMVLLTGALVATLWLSTAATADSYRLQEARESTRELTERSEQLGREVAILETAPELARRALELGMVPARDPARLVVSPDGAIAVVGHPVPASPPPATPEGNRPAPTLSASSQSGSAQSSFLESAPAVPGDGGR